MKNFAKLSILILSVSGAMVTTRAAVSVNEAYTFYDIAPKNVGDIKRELRKHSPISRQQQVFHGRTKWHIQPDFRLARRHILCRIEDVYVTVHGTYTMPRISASHVINVSTKAKFDDYYEALLEHEKGHQRLWLEAGERIDTLLRSMAPHYDCGQLASMAKTRIAAIISQYQMRNQEYDTATGHGRTQGAAIN